MKNHRREIIVFLFVVFVLMQFIRTKRNISNIIPATDITIATNAPLEVRQLLKTSCYDCHSNNTKYPWYSDIAPISYWISNNINQGKRHLNFSEWEQYSSKKKINKLKELEKEFKENHEMPLYSYLWMHKEAKLSDNQIETLLNWTNDLQFIYRLGVR